MRAAIIKELGQPPVYGDFDAPRAAPGEERVSVRAAAFSPLTKARALGQHYTVAKPDVPFVMGVDGIGLLDDGRRVYFIMPRAPFGAMAQYSVVDKRNCIALSDELDDVRAAALANPGVSSWAALRMRARFEPGQSVLVHGATGASGTMAVQIAKYMGAKRVIATGRNKAALAALKDLGADETVALGDDDKALAATLEQHFASGIDVVLDYIWGPSAQTLLAAAAKTVTDARPLTFVQIGNASAPEIRLPGALLRSAAIELRGSGFGSVSMVNFLRCIGEVLEAAPRAKFSLPTETVELAQVGEVFGRKEALPRAVMTL